MTRIFWQNAVTYHRILDGNPAFNINYEKESKPDKFVLKHFEKRVSYLIHYDDKIVIKNYDRKDSRDPAMMEFRPLSQEDDLEEAKNWKEKNIWIKIPNLKKANSEEWLRRVFLIMGKRRFHAEISSLRLLKYPFYSIEFNPRRLAGYYQITLPDNTRISTAKRAKIIKKERVLKKFGLTFDDVYNIDLNERIKLNIKNVEKAVYWWQDPEKAKKKKIEKKITRKKKKKTINNTINTGFAGMVRKNPQKAKEAQILGGKKGAITKKKNNLISKMQKLCLKDKEYAHLEPFFRTRDPEMIMSAISEILSVDSYRYLRGVHKEQTEKKGEIDSNVTALSDSISKRAAELVKLIKPDIVPTNTYNILNSKVNIGNAVENLYNAGFTKKQGQDLATEIEKILEEEKQGRTQGDVVVAETSEPQGETSSN